MPEIPPSAVDLSPPGPAETAVISRALAAVAAPESGLTQVQGLLLDAVVPAMTGHDPGRDGPPVAPGELAEALARRDAAFRGRIVQIGVLLALVVHPLPPEVARRMRRLAGALGVDEGMLAVASDYAAGDRVLAARDFERNGYTGEWDAARAGALHTGTLDAGTAAPWTVVADAPGLAARWRELEDLPDGTLGRRVTEFYRARGFVYPGLPGSAPPLLAQHDWVHVLADYGTTVASELEVFAFIARANDDLRGFSLLAMVVSLFETGALARAAGLFEADPGHLARTGMATRLADALRRGALCRGSTDFMGLDWFELADLPLDEARRRFGIPAKSPQARAAGAVGPWEPGGISAFQERAGRELAARTGTRQTTTRRSDR